MNEVLISMNPAKYHALVEERDKLKSLNAELVKAVKATDIYFKALCEQWAANDGRVVS